MAEVNLYDSHYDQYSTDVYTAIRQETYGEDLGQSSWMTADELRHFMELLQLKSSDSLLEVASGSGGCALFVAQNAGCHVTGIDINEFGINNANQLAKQRKLESVARFQLVDASGQLPFPNKSFDAVFSNDAICHIPGRETILKEWHRILKPNGRMMFTDALVVTGLVSHEEIAQRSSIGYYAYTPPGVNEKIIRDSGFALVSTEDLTEQAAVISGKWHDARLKHSDALLKMEGEAKFQGLQKFLWCVHVLCSEKRLSRFMYHAKKEEK